MKKLIFNFIILVLLISRMEAQTATTTEQKINALWVKKDHANLQKFLAAKTVGNSQDVVALYCAQHFYTMLDPDRAKAFDAANKLKAVAGASKKPAAIETADLLLTKLKKIPETFFHPRNQELLDLYHSRSPDEYPTIKFGIGMRQSMDEHK